MKIKFQIFSILLLIGINSYSQNEKKELRNGNEKYKEGKFDKAEQHYKEAIKLKPNYFKGSYNLGASQYKLGKFKEAADQFELSTNHTTSKDTLAEILHNRGTSLIKEKKYEDAIKVLKTALKINPKDEDTRYNLAFAQKKLKQQEQQGGGKNNQNQNKENQENKEKKENKDNEGKSQGDKNKEGEKKEGQGKEANQMNKEEAERMLDALKNNEKKLARKRKLKGEKETESRKTDKDW